MNIEAEIYPKYIVNQTSFDKAVPKRIRNQAISKIDGVFNR